MTVWKRNEQSEIVQEKKIPEDPFHMLYVLLLISAIIKRTNPLNFCDSSEGITPHRGISILCAGSFVLYVFWFLNFFPYICHRKSINHRLSSVKKDSMVCLTFKTRLHWNSLCFLGYPQDFSWISPGDPKKRKQDRQLKSILTFGTWNLCVHFFARNTMLPLSSLFVCLDAFSCFCFCLV